MTIFLVITMFFFGCGCGIVLLERVVNKRQNSKDGTPSASYNTTKCEILEDLREHETCLANLSKQMANLRFKVSKLSHIY